MFKLTILILFLIFSSLTVRADVLTKKEQAKLLNNNPNIIASIIENRVLQFWFLTSNGKGVIWCETFINEDTVRTETICFDEVDPDG